MPERQIKNLKDIIGLTITDAVPVTHNIKLIFNDSFVVFTGKENFTEHPDVVVDARTEGLKETRWYSKREIEG